MDGYRNEISLLNLTVQKKIDLFIHRICDLNKTIKKNSHDGYFFVPLYFVSINSS